MNDPFAGLSRAELNFLLSFLIAGEALSLHLFLDRSVLESQCRGVRAGTVLERERAIEANRLQQAHRVFKVLITLSRKSDDHVCGEGDPGARLTKPCLWSSKAWTGRCACSGMPPVCDC